MGACAPAPQILEECREAGLREALLVYPSSGQLRDRKGREPSGRQGSHSGSECFEYWMVSRAAPMSQFLVCRSLVSQPPSSEKPMDSICERDSISRGSASAKERKESREGEAMARPRLGPVLQLAGGAAPPGPDPPHALSGPRRSPLSKGEPRVFLPKGQMGNVSGSAMVT